MRKFYYDASRHGTYLEQPGITYPIVRTGPIPGEKPGSTATTATSNEVR